MGRYGAAILTVVGTIVGAYFGFPALGAVLGSLVGSLLFPTQLPTVQGPRLADLGQTASTVGAPIPRGWGTFVTPGCVIAKTDAREVIESEEVGGKGSSSQTVETPTYYQDFAIGLCDATEPIGGVRCIWANGKAIYDRRPRGADESEAAFNARMAASAQLDSQMTIYTGAEDQEPDPTLEQFFGVGQISAFRGLAYIVFENWKNKDEDGRRMPSQWKIEVYNDAEFNVSEATQYSNEVLFPWFEGDWPLNPKNEHLISEAFGGTVDGPPDFSTAGPFTTVQEAVSSHEATVGKSFENYLGYGHSAGHPDGEGLGPETAGYTTRMGAVSAKSVNAQTVYMIYNHFTADLHEAVIFGQTNAMFRAGDRVGAVCGSEMIYHTNDVQGGYAGAGSVNFRSTLPSNADITGTGWDLLSGDECGTPINYASLSTIDVAVVVSRIPREPENPCDQVGAQEIPGIEGYVIVDGELKKCGDWTYDDSQTYRVMRKYSGAGIVTVDPLNPARPLGHADDTELFWTAQYDIHVARGSMQSGLVYGVDYPENQSFGYIQDAQNLSIETGSVSVAKIQRDLCIEAGLTDGDIDVEDLETLIVPGYVRTRVMTARAASDPLRQATFYDGIETAPGIKFIRRGKPIVATLIDTTEASDLAAHVVGEEIPSRITSRDLDEVDMPRRVRLHFLSQARDYEMGEALSPVRPGIEASNDLDLELPIVLTQEQAVKIASALWADAWYSRRVHDAVIDYARQEFEPGDALGVPIDGEIHRCRIVSIVDVAPAVRKLSLVRDDDQSFVSYALPSPPPRNTAPPPPAISLPANVVLLDIPLLRDADDDPGFYAAAWSPLTGAFGGAGIYRSIDGGANYTRVAQAGTEATVGKGINLLPAGPVTVWDDGNTLRVQLASGALDSATADAVLLGANGVAYGAHGRWEIIQFRNAEYIGGDVYILRGLLRGRRGTEHNVGNHELDDRFVLLSTAAGSIAPGLLRIPLSISQVGREYLYKGVGAGTAVDSAIAISFTGVGQALKPFSPVYIQGELSGTGNWSITWLRRGRIGQTLQSGHDIPLSEDQEDYEVDIYNGDAVVRTLSVLHEGATYTAEQQLTDFGALQTSLKVIIYQLSAQVGRGTGAEANL